ncbi:MAG: hypothetical protein JRI46_10665 [Deltaproteobacteria bacterium]|nr:hypothetical protein [Deltaproteobacteria bacterium]
MDRTNRFCIGLMSIILSICLVTPLAGAQGKVEKGEKDLSGVIDVKGCEGMELTQCELAKNLITTLKMGEDLTCEEGFVHLRALDIAPGEDWSYEDPHKAVTLEEIKDVIMDAHQAYNEGNVPLDGFAVAEEINRFCLDMKGPPPASSEAEKKEILPAPGSQKEGKK